MLLAFVFAVKRLATMAEMTETKAEMTDMKVTNKKGTGFYIRAATNFLQGIEAKPAIEATEGKEGKEAIEAKAAVKTLTISGLGEAINVAVAVAAKLEADSIAKIKKVETGYPEMKDGRGCAQIKIIVKRLGGGAPFIHKAYGLEQKFVAELMADMIKEDPSIVTNDPDAMMAAMLGKRKEWFENVAKPLLEKSFKHHDKDGNGVLDKEESTAFIEHLMEECCLMLRGSLDKMVDPISAQVLPAVGVTDSKVQEVIMVKIATPMLNMMVKEMLAIVDREYFKQKDERDAAAFKTMDTNGDGKVQLSEFLAAMSPEGEDKFNKAIGFDEEQFAGEVMEKVMPSLVNIIQRELLNLQAEPAP